MTNASGKAQALGIVLLLLAGCASASPQAAPAAGTPATVSAAGPPREAGPKKRIAVAKFDAIGEYMAQYGSWDIGGGLAAQLTTALVESGKFIVVERADLANVLREQELSVQNIVSKETAVQVGGLLGAQLLVHGSVTEFDQRAGGGGLRIGIGTGLLGGGVGTASTNGTIAMDVRLIDTATGQVLQSRRVESKVSQTAVSADINVRQVSFGGDTFNKTPLGQATREAITKAVALIAQSMERVPWAGRVVEVTGDQVYINAGTNAGIKRGDLFTVTTVRRRLTDPDSGAVLGVIEDRLGEVEMVDVQEKFGIARMRTPFQTVRGDLVKSLEGAR